MKNDKEFKDLGVGERMRFSEKLGAKVAKIMNKTKKAVNALLLPYGFGVNINVDFYQLKDDEKLVKNEEVNANG